MLLSSEKRLEVLLTESYKGMRLFQPVLANRFGVDDKDRDTVPEKHNISQHAPTRNGAVRELSLK